MIVGNPVQEFKQCALDYPVSPVSSVKWLLKWMQMHWQIQTASQPTQRIWWGYYVKHAELLAPCTQDSQATQQLLELCSHLHVQSS